MGHSYCVLAAMVFVMALATRADAAVVVNIDRSAQGMSVSVDSVPRYNWRVSTAQRLHHAARHLSCGNAGAALVLGAE
jgi:hypothetical protein